MPIYEYICNKCNHSFEQLVFNSDDETEIVCKKCGEKDVKKVLSPTSVFSSGSLCAPSGGFS